MYPLTIALVLCDTELREGIQKCLEDLPVHAGILPLSEKDQDLLAERVERMRADVVILEVNETGVPVWDLVRRLQESPGRPAVIAVGAEAEPGTILTAFRTGVAEYLFPPFEPHLRNALERIAAKCHQTKAPLTSAKVFGFLSAKGGCGATTIACHLALQLPRLARKKVLLLDLDLINGVIGVLMTTKSEHSVMAALQNTERLDASYWQRLASPKVPNLHVLAAPGLRAMQQPPSEEAVRHVLRFSRSLYECILVDLGCGSNPVALAAVEEVDHLLLATTTEICALHRAQHIVAALTAAGYPQQRIRLILNQTPAVPGLPLWEFERLLGCPIWATLPEDYNSLYAAYAEGKLLPESAPLSQALVPVACRLAEIELPAPRQSRFRFLSLRGGFRRHPRGPMPAAAVVEGKA